jgi:His-Xaa-Ser system radical SAM maturase HxsB
MLNYFNFAYFNAESVLLTNDFGEYHFLPNHLLSTLVRNPELLSDELKVELLEKRFLIPDNIENIMPDIIYEFQNAKKYLLCATSLHIFVITNQCNGYCIYCQAQHVSSMDKSIMSYDVAQKSVDIALSSPSRYLSFEFQGGEPLMGFDVIKFIIEYAEKNKGNHIIEFNLVSNLSLLDNYMTEFFIIHNVSISTSLDGNKSLHDTNRPMINNESSYNSVVQRIHAIRDINLNIGAIQTTTRKSLYTARSIVDEYVKQGFVSIFIRPLTPLGFAATRWEDIGYSANDYTDFYKEAIHYIIDLNKRSVQIKEGYASLFLSKILHGNALNYMELRSPCGAGIGQLAYYLNGDIYTCDEARMLAEMGNQTFKLGNVFENTYDELMNSSSCKASCAASTLESLPESCDCVYQPYCGVCPVVSLACHNDIISSYANDYHCAIFGGMLKTLFEILYQNDTEEISILESWV